jgi:hypothetical protein
MRSKGKRTVDVQRAVMPTTLVAIVLLSIDAHGVSSKRVTGEAVDHYYNQSCGLYSTISCIAEMDNFRNGLLNAPGTIFLAGYRYTEAVVFDTDFTDPEGAGGTSIDQDLANFDHSGNAIAYTSLHGACADTTTQSCTHSSQCTSPPSGMSLPGVCIGPGPNNGTNGWCAYLTNKYLVTSSCGTAGQKYGGTVDYTHGGVRWGESTYSGNWAGAGTNGGLTFALLVNSCGVRPGFVQQEVTPMFAGMTVLGMVMPVTPQWADDIDAPVRGTALANAYVTNPNGSIGQAWTDSLFGVPSNDGRACGGNYSFGGGHGMNGCGAQITVDVDSTSTLALWDRDTKSWAQATDPTLAATGFGWWTYKFSCNYDCLTYPMILN